MYKNKQGMSAIVTTLIIIALSLVAIGAVWYVIQNLLSNTETEVEQGSGDIFSDCVTDMGGTVMINETHTDDTTICSDDVKLIGGEYCCIP